MEGYVMKQLLLAAAVAALVAVPANAAITVLTFEGLANNKPVGGFYAPDYIFSPATLALIDADAGGTGNFANEPTPSTIMFFLDANNAILGATGNVLGVINLAANAFGCPGDPTGGFSCWNGIGVAFSGTAYSIDFSGTANQTGFDNITFGQDTPVVPEPATWAMLIAGFGLVGTAVRRRRAALTA
jgi:hypothetical protein